MTTNRLSSAAIRLSLDTANTSSNRRTPQGLNLSSMVTIASLFLANQVSSVSASNVATESLTALDTDTSTWYQFQFPNYSYWDFAKAITQQCHLVIGAPPQGLQFEFAMEQNCKFDGMPAGPVVEVNNAVGMDLTQRLVDCTKSAMLDLCKLYFDNQMMQSNSTRRPSTPNNTGNYPYPSDDGRTFGIIFGIVAGAIFLGSVCYCCYVAAKHHTSRADRTNQLNGYEATPTGYMVAQSSVVPEIVIQVDAAPASTYSSMIQPSSSVLSGGYSSSMPHSSAHRPSSYSSSQTRGSGQSTGGYFSSNGSTHASSGSSYSSSAQSHQSSQSHPQPQPQPQPEPASHHEVSVGVRLGKHPH